MSWYTLCQNADGLSKVIGQWLIQAYYGPIDMSQADADLKQFMINLSTDLLNNAVTAGENYARNFTKQQGTLNEYQNNFLNYIQSKFINDSNTVNDGMNSVGNDINMGVSNEQAQENGQNQISF